MKAKLRERAEARRLRAEHGLPLKQIAAQLGVSPASVVTWTQGITVTPEQAARNRHRPWTISGKRWAEKARTRRRASQAEGRRRARKGEPLHQAGCMLFWAEGSKERNSVRFANSDIHMVRFFRAFLSECFGLTPGDFRVHLNVYLGNGLSIGEIETHWLESLELPRSALRSHSINAFPTSTSGRKTNKLPYGVCSLCVFNTNLVQHLYGAVQEYGGFDAPGWLDCAVSSRARQADILTREAQREDRSVVTA